MHSIEKQQHTSSKLNVFNILMFSIQSRLNSTDFNKDNVLKIIRALNTYKTYDHDISIRIIKICDKSLLKPLILLFENSTKSSCYLDIWKDLI